MSNFTPNRVAAGKSDGGQFAAKINSEQDIDLDIASENYTSAYAALSDESNKPVTLTYAEYDDSLSDEQVEKVLKGEWLEVEQEVDENFYDLRHDEARKIAEAEINFLHSEGKFHAEWDDLDDEEQDNARLAVESRDDSDLTGQLLKTTHGKYLAANLGHVRDELGSDSEILGEDYHGKHNEARAELISSMLAKKGLDTSNPEAKAAIRKLVNDAGGYWDDVNVQVVWNGPVEEAAARGRGGDEFDASGRKLSFSNPEIVINTGGYGYGKATIPGTIRHTVTPEDPAVIDHDSNANLNIQNSFVSTDGWVK